MDRQDDRRGLLDEEAFELNDATDFKHQRDSGESPEPTHPLWQQETPKPPQLAFLNPHKGRSGRRLVLFAILFFIFVLLWAGWGLIAPQNTGDQSFRWDIGAFSDKGALSLPAGYEISKRAKRCHSHNDYWRKVPLFEALHYGCLSVEADVWLQQDGELLVGHEEKALVPGRTFLSLYVNRIAEILDSRPEGTGIFEDQPTQTLVLLVDVKTGPDETFAAVQLQLEYLRARGYLTYYNGSSVIPGLVTVVASGNAPFEGIIANETYRDVFFDAPVLEMYKDLSKNPDAEVYEEANSWYASGSFYEAFGWKPFVFGLNSGQVRIWKEQIQMAHDRGLRHRFWETPSWPSWTRNSVWQHVIDLGGDNINADDLKAVTQFLDRHGVP